MKLIIEVDDLSADQLKQLKESSHCRQYNDSCELRWYWPTDGPAKAMTDFTIVTAIEAAP